MLKVPRFFRDEGHRKQVIAKLQLTQCPTCNKIGALIRNGMLRGNEVSLYQNTQTIRAQRILCSERKKTEQGCGVSFSIYKNTCLPRLSINAGLLTALLKAYLDLNNVHAAGQSLAASFSLSSAYRLWKRLDLAQSTVRQRLCRVCQRTEGLAACHEPRQALIKHLLIAFEQSDVPIASYQAHFQAPFLD